MASKQSSCGRTLCITGLVAVVAASAGILIWQLLPEDNKAAVTCRFGNSTDCAPPPTPSPNTATSPSGEASPTAAPAPAFSFYQCSTTTSSSNSGNCCNGLDNGVCNLRVDELIYGYMHNAVATDDDGFVLYNHKGSLEKALQAGFRAFELDVGYCNDSFVLYHAQCILGTRDPLEVFTNIQSFLADNPTEVVLFNLQMDTEITLSQVANVIAQVDGLNLYNHPNKTTPWPTLGSLVADNTRVILFYHNQVGCDEQTCPTGFHYYFDYGIETEYEFDTVSQIMDTNYSCALKGYGGTNFFRVNSFLQLPSENAAETLNAYDFGNTRIDDCQSINDLHATFYAVDFWQTGDVLQVVQDINTKAAAAAQRRKRRELLRGNQ